MIKLHLITLSLLLFTASLRAQPVLFDFNSGPYQTSLPLDLTISGVTAHFSATGQGFSIQNPSTTIGMVPAGFSGYCISPNSVFAADLLVSFTQPLNAFSIMYAFQELACDSSATMRVTAYLNNTLVGTNTTFADPPGTWPSATLSFNSSQIFDRVVVHYAVPPPTGGDWGPIFVADNMVITVAAVPEPTSLLLLGSCFTGAVSYAVMKRIKSKRLKNRWLKTVPNIQE